MYVYVRICVEFIKFKFYYSHRLAFRERCGTLLIPFDDLFLDPAGVQPHQYTLTSLPTKIPKRGKAVSAHTTPDLSLSGTMTVSLQYIAEIAVDASTGVPKEASKIQLKYKLGINSVCTTSWAAEACLANDISTSVSVEQCSVGVSYEGVDIILHSIQKETYDLGDVDDDEDEDDADDDYSIGGGGIGSDDIDTSEPRYSVPSDDSPEVKCDPVVLSALGPSMKHTPSLSPIQEGTDEGRNRNIGPDTLKNERSARSFNSGSNSTNNKRKSTVTSKPSGMCSMCCGPTAADAVRPQRLSASINRSRKSPIARSSFVENQRRAMYNKHKDAVLSTCKERENMNNGRIRIVWDNILSIDEITDSILSLSLRVDRYLGEEKGSGNDLFRPVTMQLYVLNCPAKHLRNLIEERSTFASYRLDLQSPTASKQELFYSLYDDANSLEVEALRLQTRLAATPHNLKVGSESSRATVGLMVGSSAKVSGSMNDNKCTVELLDDWVVMASRLCRLRLYLASLVCKYSRLEPFDRVVQAATQPQVLQTEEPPSPIVADEEGLSANTGGDSNGVATWENLALVHVNTAIGQAMRLEEDRLNLVATMNRRVEFLLGEISTRIVDASLQVLPCLHTYLRLCTYLYCCYSHCLTVTVYILTYVLINCRLYVNRDGEARQMAYCRSTYVHY